MAELEKPAQSAQSAATTAAAADAGNGLFSEGLAADPRLAEARRLIREAVADHQRRLEGPRPPRAGRQVNYEEMLEMFQQLRGRPLYFPYVGSGFGRGPLVELADGSVKYDMISGIGVNWLGHLHPSLVDAGLDAALQDTIMQGNLQQTRESALLGRELLELARRGGAALDHCFLTTSGAMANENALKLAFQKKFPADRLLAFEGAFAGRTLATVQITDRPAYRQGLPATVAVDRVPLFDPQRPAESTAAAVQTLREHLGHHPGRHAAMIFELVLGEGGFYPGNREFFLPLMAELQARDVAIVIDEIQTFGRLSAPFAFQYFGLESFPDIVTVGKMLQTCATLFSDRYLPDPGLLSQTFTASTSAIFAARAILQELTTGDYFGPQGRIERLHGHFVRGLQAIGARHPGCVNGPFGAGAMVAFTPLDGSSAIAHRMVQMLFQAGVIAFVAGASPTRLRFLMPVGAIEPADLDAVCQTIEQTLLTIHDEMETARP